MWAEPFPTPPYLSDPLSSPCLNPDLRHTSTASSRRCRALSNPPTAAPHLHPRATGITSSSAIYSEASNCCSTATRPPPATAAPWGRPPAPGRTLPTALWRTWRATTTRTTCGPSRCVVRGARRGLPRLDMPLAPHIQARQCPPPFPALQVRGAYHRLARLAGSPSSPPVAATALFPSEGDRT